MHYQGNAVPKRKSRFWCGVIGICIVILLAWLMEAWGHGEGKCLTDVDGNVPLSNGGWVKIIDHLEGADLDGFVHGHRSQYYDRHGNPTGQATGFFSIDFDDSNSPYYASRDRYHADCPTAPPPRSSQSSTAPRSSNTPTLAETLDRIIKEDPEPPVDIEIPEPPPPPPVAELVQWEYQFWKGWNLMSFPVLPEGVETISDLYHHWAFFTAHNGHIVVNLDGEWTLYSGAEGEPTGDIPLSAHLGLAVRLDWATYLGVRGVPLPSAETIDLHAGTNLVGFPELPANIRRPSDFLSDVICAVIVTRRGEFYLVGRAGDSGDEALEPGQAVILIAIEPTRLDSTESTPSAPSVTRQGTLTTSWGAMKQ